MFRFTPHTSHLTPHTSHLTPLSKGQRPNDRALHPKVMSVIAQQGLYAFSSDAITPQQAVQLSRNHDVQAPPAAPQSPATIAAQLSAELATPARKCHVVVLFGVHGVGKGTVAHALCRKHGYAHVSFGERDTPPR